MAEQTNFGKGALITGIILGVAAGAFGVYTMTGSKLDRPQTDLNTEGTKAAAALEVLADEAVAARKKSHAIVDVAPEGATINGKPRYTPIFFSPELWQVSVDAEKKNTVIDVYDPSAQNIHEGVPNHWFISHGIEDALGRADGLALDSDSDGFTNREEFEAETHPGDAKSLPQLVQQGKTPKLEVVSVSEARAVIGVDSTLAYEASPTSANIRIYSRPGETRPQYKIDARTVGSTFGLSKEGDDKRFTIVGFEKADFTDMSGNKSSESVVRVRDNVTASAKNREFIVRAGTPTKPDAKDFDTPNAKGYSLVDTTVELRVTAGAKAGSTVRVQLQGSFTVPGTDISCELESVNEDGSVNVKPEGAQSPILVPKAAK